MSYCLVVVDVQHFFTASRSPSLRSNCLKAIDQAKKDQAHIIFLEYEGYGKTIPLLRNKLSAYKKAYFAKKVEDDGSEELYRLLRSKKIASKLFKFAGVNTDYCVLSTIEGLLKIKKQAKVHVLEPACNSDDDHKNGLRQMKKLSDRVSIKRKF